MKNKNLSKKYNFLSWLILALPIFLAVFFVFSIDNKSLAESKEKIVVTEIMYDDEDTDSSHSDWIELYNNGSAPIILTDNFGIIDEEKLVLGKDGKHYLNCHTLKETISMENDEYIVLANDSTKFKSDYKAYAGQLLKLNFDLSSKGDFLWLSDDRCETFFAALSYDDSWGGKNNGKTLELINTDKKYEKNNWQQSYQKRGTPGDKCSEKQEYEKKIYINEIYPKPTPGKFEFIELYNAANEKISLDEWKIEDKAGKECLLNGKSINPEEYIVLANDPENDCDIALNDTSEEIVYLKNPNDEIVSQSELYKSAKAGQSLAFNGNKWRWTKFLTPGEENIFNNLPEEKKTSVPKEAYTNTYANFTAKVSDVDGDKVKITWDFGDGHKSYLAKTKHKYQKEGKYKVSLKITDGSEDVIKEFTIKVEDYPERKVRIVAINANPVGKDTEGESITVLNKSKKKINFNGWSVATGANSKKLVNHPIKEDYEVKPGKTGEITRDICALTLNNKKGVVELRYPDSSAAHSVKYKKQDKSGVKEGEVYEKVGSEWKWNANAKIANSKLQISNNNQNLISNNQMEEGTLHNVESAISPEEVGKRSEIEIENKLEENPYLESTSLPSKPSVLGIATVRAAESSYHFTPETTPEEHYAIVFLRKAGLLINYSINKVISHFL